MGAFDSPNILPQNNGVLTDINVSDITTATPNGYQTTDYEQQIIDANNAQFAPDAIGPQGAGLYPGLNHNINVGSVSDPMFGSQNIYVPGGNIMAIDPILARRKAIDDAAKKRALEISKPFEYQKPKSFKDARFQEKFNKDFNKGLDSIISKAKAQDPLNFRALLKDQSTQAGRELAQYGANMEAIVNNTDSITDLVATIDKGLADNSMYLSPKAKKQYDDYKGMLNNFSDHTKMSGHDFETLHASLVGQRDLNDYFNESGILNKLQAQITEYSRESDTGTTYTTRAGKTTDYSGIIQDVAKQVKEQSFPYDDRTVEDFAAVLGARLKNSVSTTKSIDEKSEGAIGRDEAEQINAWDSKNTYALGKEKVLEGTSYDSEGKRTGNFKIKSWGDLNGKITSDKDVEVNERTAEGKIQTKKVRGVGIDGIEVLQPDGSTRVVPGTTYANFGNTKVIQDPNDDKKYLIVVEAEVEVPTRKENKEGSSGNLFGVTGEGDTYSTQKSYVVISRNGVGTGTESKIKTSLKKKSNIDNYEKGIEELKKVGEDRTGQNRKGVSAKEARDKKVKSEAEEDGL